MELDRKIADLYYDFNKKILSIIKENEKATLGYFKAQKKIADQHNSIEEKYGSSITETTFTVPEEWIEEMDSLKNASEEVNLGMFLSSNANFIYLIALYETFLNSLVKLMIEEHHPTRKKYMQYFLTRANELAKNGNTKLIDMILSPKKCIENLDELQPLMSVLNFLVEHNKIDEMYQEYYSEYLEARERRNLFVHRGHVLDTKYEKSFKQLLGFNNLTKYFEPIIKKAKNRAKPLPKKWIGGKKDCSHQFPKNDDNSCSKCTAIYGIEPGFDLSVGPGYIRHVYDSIFFLSAAIYRKALANVSNKKSKILNEDIFHGALHDHMVYGLNSNLSFSQSYGGPLSINAYCDKNISVEKDDITTINHILCLNELSNAGKVTISNKEGDDLKINIKEYLFLELDKIVNENKKSIVRSYLNQDYKTYLELALKECGGDKTSFQKWFMTVKFLKNKKFKTLFNKI